MRAQTDFNARCPEGCVLVLREELPSSIWEGEMVTLFDAEGNEAEGEIYHIESELVHVSVDWSTWRP